MLDPVQQFPHPHGTVTFDFPRPDTPAHLPVKKIPHRPFRLGFFFVIFAALCPTVHFLHEIGRFPFPHRTLRPNGVPPPLHRQTTVGDELFVQHPGHLRLGIQHAVQGPKPSGVKDKQQLVQVVPLLLLPGPVPRRQRVLLGHAVAGLFRTLLFLRFLLFLHRGLLAAGQMSTTTTVGRGGGGGNTGRSSPVVLPFFLHSVVANGRQRRVGARHHGGGRQGRVVVVGGVGVVVRVSVVVVVVSVVVVVKSTVVAVGRERSMGQGFQWAARARVGQGRGRQQGRRPDSRRGGGHALPFQGQPLFQPSFFLALVFLSGFRGFNVLKPFGGFVLLKETLARETFHFFLRQQTVVQQLKLAVDGFEIVGGSFQRPRQFPCFVAFFHDLAGGGPFVGVAGGGVRARRGHGGKQGPGGGLSLGIVGRRGSGEGEGSGRRSRLHWGRVAARMDFCLKGCCWRSVLGLERRRLLLQIYKMKDFS